MSRTPVRPRTALLVLASVTALSAPAAVALTTSGSSRASAVGLGGETHPVATSPAPQITSARLAGADRYATAVAVSRAAFPSGARAAYLVADGATVDAVSAGMLADGPVLLVPGRGPVPAAVLAEIRRLGRPTVYAVGGPSSVADATLAQVAQGRPVARLAGADRYATAVAVSRHAFATPPTGPGSVAVYATPTDGVAAGQLPGTPVLPVPATGPVPAVVRAEIARVAGKRASVPVVAVGRSVGEATLRSAAGTRGTDRIAGPDATVTSALVADTAADALGGSTVLLARSDSVVDAVVAGPVRAPLLLVPRRGPLPDTTRRMLTVLGPRRVVVLGGAGSVGDSILRQAREAAAQATSPASPAAVQTTGVPLPTATR